MIVDAVTLRVTIISSIESLDTKIYFTSFQVFVSFLVWSKLTIAVKWQNIGDMCGSTGKESCRTQFDTLPLHEWESSRKGGAYDMHSVMHYGMYFEPKLASQAQA